MLCCLCVSYLCSIGPRPWPLLSRNLWSFSCRKVTSPVRIISGFPISSRMKRSPKPRRKHQVNGCPADAEKDRLITTDSDGTYKRPPGVHNSAYIGCPVRNTRPLGNMVGALGTVSWWERRVHSIGGCPVQSGGRSQQAVQNPE